MIRIAAVLLAAGRGTRFGGDKLAADLAGSPLAHHAARTLAAIPFGWRLAVVAEGDAPPGFAAVRNPDPAAGQGRSLALGVAAARRAGADAVLVALADMPCVSAGHLRRILAGYDGARTLVASTDGETRLPPALFGSHWFDRLLAATGDRGARDLLAEAEPVRAGRDELIDIDTSRDLADAALRMGDRDAAGHPAARPA